MRFICLKYIHASAFFRGKMSMCVSFRSYKIRKTLNLVDFHSLQQLLLSQVYRMVFQWFSNVKFLKISEGESNRKLPKMFSGKNLPMTQKKLHALIELKSGLT